MSLATAEKLEDIKARNKELIDEVLEVYPDKFGKRRAKHLGTFEEGKPDCGVKSNIKSRQQVKKFQKELKQMLL